MSSSALVELLRLFDGTAISGVARRWLGCRCATWNADPAPPEVLGRRGFAIQRGAPPHSFVLADHSGLEVDVHAVVFDAHGNGVHRVENGEDWTFPPEGFSGRGVVNGTGVRCLSPTTQVLCHATVTCRPKGISETWR